MSVRGRNEVRWWGWNSRIPVALYSYVLAHFLLMVASDHFPDEMVYRLALALPLSIGFYIYSRNPISVITIAVLAASVIGTVFIATSV